jgi:8-oxo-dGTP diphosphatase
MEYKIAVKGIIRREDGDILIVKRSENDDYFPGMWETVGGGMDEELMPQDALKREIKEEVGLEVKVCQPFNVFPIIKDNGETKIGLTFICDYVGGEVVLSAEHSEFAWIKPNNFREYKTIPALYREISSYANMFGDEHEKFAISQKGILIRDGKCLILTLNEDSKRWDIPGGRINVGENKLAGLKRELFEELGVKDIKIISTLHYDAWHTPIGYAICGVASLIEVAGDIEIKLSCEHTNHAWISKDEIDNYNFIWPEMPTMIKRGFEEYERIKKGKQS